MSKIINATFKIDPALDIAGYRQIKSHLELIDWMDYTAPKNDLDMSTQVQTYHKNNKEELVNVTSQVEEQWRLKEDVFAKLAKKYFTKNDFPDEEYVCYPTIWPSIARDPQKHLVAFPARAKVNDSCAIIAHELLHELFYHHLYNTFGNSIDLTLNSIYNISEVFNVLVLRENEWQKEFSFDVQPYTKHVELLNLLSPIWENGGNVDRFVRQAISIVN